LTAQTALTIQPEHCVWRAGDNPAWAAPDLDESGWRPVSQWIDGATQTPNFWLRCRFQPNQLAPSVHPDLQVSGDLAWQVFVGGRAIGQSGNLITGAHTVGMAVDYDASEFSRRDHPILVAVRMTFTPEINGYQPLPQLALGDARLQTSTYWSDVYQQAKAPWVTWACHAIIASAGLFFLALFWFDRTQRFVLWISLSWLTLADLRVNEFLAAASVHYSARLEFLLYAIGQNLPVFIIPFFFALNRKPMPRLFQAIVGINLIFALALEVAVFLPLKLSMELRWWAEVNPTINTIQILATLVSALTPIVAFWPMRSIPRERIPLAVVCFVWMLIDSAYFVVQFPFLHLDIAAMFLRIQPLRSLAIAIVMVSLTLLLVQHIRSTNRDRAALAGEMLAAQQVQRMLAPAVLDSAPGMRIDAAFRPIREVGGDFYSCRILPGNRQRMLIGDVSGKGAAAAMAAAVLIGAAQRRESESPATLLAHLNQVLSDMRLGGFATCLCADLSPEGALTIANAGHLAPYRNGEEVPLDSCLPLGIAPDAVYTESTIRLAPNDRLTFLSDGVVEAQSVSGELFGFDRTRGISMQSAEEIARAAQAHGQEDDITVLTLNFAPAEAVQA
jgi:hypothetical protein